MAQASSQHKLDRVRPPRVHITYDVEIGDAIEIRSLPFQIAVLGDFSGMPAQPLPRLRDRTFVEVNPDNFDEVLEGMKARLAFTVENRLAGTDGAPSLGVELHFKALQDFEPENVARQVKPLRELIELRTKLNDLLGKLQGNDKLEELLTEAITDPNKLKKLESEIHGGDTLIAAPPAAPEAISVEPQALPAIEEASPVEVAEVTESVPEEETAPPTEAEPVALAPEVEEVEEVEEQVTPAVEAAATDASAEPEGSGIPVTEDKAD